MRKLGLLIFAVLALALGAWQISRSHTFQFFGGIVAAVETDARVVALTFDDGPTQRDTPVILATLAEHDIRATFFLTGREAEANPGALSAIIAAGHEIGNHSYNHDRLILMRPARIRAELARVDQIFRDAGYRDAIPFRPPYFKKLIALPKVLKETDRKTILASIIADEAPQFTPSAIADHVVTHTAPGAIILAHPMYRHNQPTRDALPDILSRLKDQGYRFVTVSELHALQN